MQPESIKAFIEYEFPPSSKIVAPLFGQHGHLGLRYQKDNSVCITCGCGFRHLHLRIYVIGDVFNSGNSVLVGVMPVVFISVVPLEVDRICLVIEYYIQYMLADIGLTELNRWCDGSFGDVTGVRLHIGCRIWFD